MYSYRKTTRTLLLAVFCILLNTTGAFSQFKFLSEEIRYSLHAKTSILFSTIKGDYNKREKKPSYKMGPSFGCYLSVALNDQFFVEPGAFLSMKGSVSKINYTTLISNSETNIYLIERGKEERELYYIDIPVMVYYRMESKVSVGMGFSGSVLVKSKNKQQYSVTEIVDYTLSYKDVSISNSNISDFRTFDSGFLFSIGYMLKDGVEFSAHSYSGLLDMKDSDRKFKNAGFGISLSYRFKQL
ncbi:MAG: PorT family protein [Bacteroidetes bacterium]|nr:PorT family protein [Bacteroidota bacterium]